MATANGVPPRSFSYWLDAWDLIGLCGWLPLKKKIRAIAEAISKILAPTNTLTKDSRTSLSCVGPFPVRISARDFSVAFSLSRQWNWAFQTWKEVMWNLASFRYVCDTQNTSGRWRVEHNIVKFINSKSSGWKFLKRYEAEHAQYTRWRALNAF